MFSMVCFNLLSLLFNFALILKPYCPNVAHSVPVFAHAVSTYSKVFMGPDKQSTGKALKYNGHSSKVFDAANWQNFWPGPMEERIQIKI